MITQAAPFLRTRFDVPLAIDPEDLTAQLRLVA